MKKILIVYNEIPNEYSGGNIRVYNEIKELSKYNEITLLTIPKHFQDRSVDNISPFCKIIISEYFSEDFKGIKKISNFFERIIFWIKRNIKTNVPSIVRRHNYQISVLKKSLEDLLEKNQFDIIQIEHSYLGGILCGVKTPAKKIIAFHNVHSLMEEGRKEKRLIFEFEKYLSTIYDTAICCSGREKNILKGYGFNDCMVVGNGVDLEYFKPNKNALAPERLIFIGDMTYPPNTKGIEYFIDKIYLLLSRKPKLEIIGNCNNLKKISKKNPNIILHGFKKDIRPFFNGSIFVCPLLSGGGTRLKILTSMAMRTPVVSTSKGAEGISYTKDKNILISDNPADFAASIESLLENDGKYQDLANSALKLVRERYDWKKIFEVYKKEL